MLLTKSLLHTTDVYIKKLKEAGIETVRDFLMLFPKDFEDKSDVLTRFSLINITEKQAIQCTIELLTSEMTRNKKLLIKAVLTDSDGMHAEAVWFNQRLILSKFAKGDTVLIFGKPKYEYGRLSFPSVEIEHFSSKRQEIQPVYSDVNYIPGAWIREKMKLVKPYLRELSLDDEGTNSHSPLSGGARGSFIPEEIRKKHSMRTLEENISAIHFPHDITDFERAKYELGYGELFRFQMIGVEKKYKALAESEGHAVATPLDSELMKTLIEGLPFPLTNKQKIVLFQITKDMEKPHAMARLLQGDVGTGKTVVALLAAIHMILKNRHESTNNSIDLGEIGMVTPLTGGAGGVISENSRGGSFRQGFFEYNRKLTEYAHENRKEMSEPEKIFWYQILHQEFFLPFHFRRQKPIGNYIADFYSSKLQLVIEIDGESHLNKKEHDEERTIFFTKEGLRELRFSNKEVIENTEGVYENLVSWIQSNPPVSPLSGGSESQVQNPLTLTAPGIQIAIMAPTEILARQHFAGSEAWLMELGIRSDLLVGSLTPRMKEDARERLKNGQTDIIFGTHALIQDRVQFQNLGFVVVDEQHRFGVEQPKVLEEYISKLGTRDSKLEETPEQNRVTSHESRITTVPHRLNMSATPIPRTLALTIYGDQDVSVLDEYPAGRKPIHTRVIREEKRVEVYRFIEEEIRQGRQVYWISPLVDGTKGRNLGNGESEGATLSERGGRLKNDERQHSMSEFVDPSGPFGTFQSGKVHDNESKEDIASAVEMQITLSAVFPKLTIGLIHGRMSGKEKDKVMQDFYENKIHILSSTSVVEVGVNNPNATIICIEASERFGLSQLHQFRGRVGRGEHQSYCYLFTTKEYKTDRLKAMEQTNDGFELAEIDLELRGPGEVYGVRQSGVPDFHFADLRDVNLISEIREDIEEWMKSSHKYE